MLFIGNLHTVINLGEPLIIINRRPGQVWGQLHRNDMLNTLEVPSPVTNLSNQIVVVLLN